MLFRSVIVSSGVAGWGYTIRTAEHCEYVVVDIVSRTGGQTDLDRED